MTNISLKDFTILLELETNPFISISELAKKLNLSRPTTAKHIQRLKENRIIKETIAIYEPESLGLQRISVLTSVPSFKALNILEKACWEHPYTFYRARTYGGEYGIFMQFNIPPNTDTRLQEFLIKLKQMGFLTDFRMFKSKGIRAHSSHDLSRYNYESSNWKFSWEEWFSTLHKNPSNLPEPILPTNNYSNFKKSHFEVLRLLNQNAEIKQIEISEKLKISKTEAHRQYKYVMDNYVSQVRLVYDRDNFYLTETYLAIGSFVTPERQAQIYHQLKNHPPPFQSAYDILNDNQIIFWANMSLNQANSFIFSIWQTLQHVKIYILSTKMRGSAIYWFYPPNFDFENMKWRDSRDYMVKEPIERLLKRIEN
ncbi:MAG: Lrp/AsnC family transcriptional regulator [Candidatus Heimdallarchaeaceae archaeon]